MPESGDPSRLDLGAIRSDLGYFLSTGVTPQPFPPADHTNTPQWQHCSTYLDSAPTLKTAVLELIRSARRKIFVTSFILGDNDLIDTLVDAANRLQGGVYVISQLSETSLKRGLTELDNHDNPSQKMEAEKKRFLSLTQHGIALRGHENCHAKFVVVDDLEAWVGTANLETRAFTIVGEVGVVTTDTATVDTLARLFTTMWFAECRWVLPGSATNYNVISRDLLSAPCARPRPAALGPHPGLVWTGSREQSVLDNIRDVLGRARHRLRLASFSLKDMSTRPDLLLEPLAEAIDGRQLHVELLVRGLNHREGHRRDADTFHRHGVHVVADPLNHAKAVVADDRHGMLFSANFDAEHGLEAGKGVEVGVRLDGTAALPELVRYLEHAITGASLEYVPSPTQRQLDHGLDARWKRRWPLAHELAIRSDSDVWTQFRRHARTGPVLWERRGDEPVELFAGTGRWRLLPISPKHYRLHQLTTVDGSKTTTANRLSTWWRRSCSVGAVVAGEAVVALIGVSS